MEKSSLPGAPELPGSESPKPQLLKELKPAPAPIVETVDDSDEPDEPDELNEHVEDPGDPDGVIAAEAARQRWNEEHPSPLPPKATKKKRRWPVILMVLVLLIAGAAAAYWFGMRTAGAPGKQATQTKQPSAPPPEQIGHAQMKHYDSTLNTLGIDYPSDWVVSDTAESLTLTSGVTTFTDSTGIKVKGKLTFMLQNQQSTVPGYPATGAIASLASEKLSYTKPSASQRAQTYLSYLGFKNASDLDRLYITGDNGYQVGQQVPQTDLTGMNTLVSVSFAKCSNTACTDAGTPLTLQASSWASSTSATTIKTVIESIAFI